MKKFYSICIASHDEVLFRSEQDYNTFTNLMALAAFRCDVNLIADAIMSTHVHFALMASDPSSFVATLRHSYGCYFNRVHDRQGRLGPKGFFVQEINGLKHRNMLLSYILRNGLHHAQSATAFGYKHCTVNSVFNRELGRNIPRKTIISRAQIASALPRYSEFPDSYVMDEQKVFTRESFMEIKLLESLFVTPRNFLFQMNRITDEIWINEQNDDQTGEKAITLNDVEKGYTQKNISRMLECEKGFKYDANKLNDTSVCQIIDTQLIRKYKASSIYILTDAQKIAISRLLQSEFKIPAKQAYRCLAMKPDKNARTAMDK